MHPGNGLFGRHGPPAAAPVRPGGLAPSEPDISHAESDGGKRYGIERSQHCADAALDLADEDLVGVGVQRDDHEPDPLVGASGKHVFLGAVADRSAPERFRRSGLRSRRLR